jgi:hypothetical protein
MLSHTTSHLLVVVLVASFALVLGANVGLAANDQLVVAQDESSMERVIESYLTTMHGMVATEKMQGSDDLTLELPFKTDPMPKFRIVIDTEAANRDKNTNAVTERTVLAWLYTAVKVPPKRRAAVLEVINDFTRNKIFASIYKAGLERKSPIRAAKVDLSRNQDVGIEYRSYDFPETNLPLSLHGTAKVQAAFYSSRRIGKGNDAPASIPEDETRVVAMFPISRRDGSGAAWVHTLHSVADSDTAKLQGQRLELALPQLDPDRLKLEVVAKVEKRKAGIGLQVKSGDVAIDDVLKGNTNAPATIEIVDLEGRTVVSEKGDL